MSRLCNGRVLRNLIEDEYREKKKEGQNGFRTEWTRDISYCHDYVLSLLINFEGFLNKKHVYFRKIVHFISIKIFSLAYYFSHFFGNKWISL